MNLEPAFWFVLTCAFGVALVYLWTIGRDIAAILNPPRNRRRHTLARWLAISSTLTRPEARR